MTTGEKFKIIRDKLHLSQNEFAEKLGIKQNNLSMIETNRNQCTIEHLNTLFNKINVSPLWFFSNPEQYLPTIKETEIAFCARKLDQLALLESFIASQRDYCKQILSISDEEVSVIAKNAVRKHSCADCTIEITMYVEGKPVFKFDPHLHNETNERGQS